MNPDEHGWEEEKGELVLPYAVMETVTRVVASAPIAIRRAALTEILDLRYAILRPGLPRATADFAGDAEPSTHHFGAFAAARCVGCASFMLSPWDGQPAWQLRGMATAEDWRGRGLGRDLLRFAEMTLRADDQTRLWWCNARLGAVRFYERQGWRIVSEQFDIPTVGPHHRMLRTLE